MAATRLRSLRAGCSASAFPKRRASTCMWMTRSALVPRSTRNRMLKTSPISWITS
ncbi:hypothetical protein EKH49_08635 [Glutamicibacter sp. HZAU]|nr:hypothetical protein EKH49_08635 [Glutamicibacter sp. HZAU]